MLWVLVLVLVVLWAGGYYRGPAPVRGNNALHLLLVLVVVLVALELLGVLPRLGHPPRLR
jgi:hypothetical protein